MYSSQEDFHRLYRKVLEDKVRSIISKTNKANKAFSSNHKSKFFGFIQKELTSTDRMHMERNIWRKIQSNPFILLTALKDCMPDCSFVVKGSSVNLERKIEISLARDIMLNKAVVPLKYLPEPDSPPSDVVIERLNEGQQEVGLLPSPIHFNSDKYYSERFIDFLKENDIEKAVVVVTSWSDGALHFPRSPYIGSRQSRDLPHHILLAQKLKQQGIDLKIYYLAFDNTLHFNHKDKRAVDNTLLPAFKNYLLSFNPTKLDDSQLESIYLNPQYKVKSGDVVIDELPQIQTVKGSALSLTGKNALQLKELKNKLVLHSQNGDYIIGMTAHSTGDDLAKLSRYLGLEVVGCTMESIPFGTKEGNKQLFKLADVPFVYGSTKAKKSLECLYGDCYEVAVKTGCKRLMIKHNSSSAGKGNLIVDISSCYRQGTDECDLEAIKRVVYHALIHHKHPDKDRSIIDGSETFYMRKIRELGAIVEEMKEADSIASPGSLAVVNPDGTVDVEYIYDQILTGKDGQNFGGSLGPSSLSEDDVAQMIVLTKQVGMALYNQCAYGYFGLDFLKCDDKPLIVIEANLRKTGTRYPFMFVSHLLGEERLKNKFLFHDDNIHLPIKITDLPGRNFGLQHYMSCLYNYLLTQPIHYNDASGCGVIVSFDTHSAGKLGVLSIADTRVEVASLNQEFRKLLANFTTEHYPQNALAQQFYGLSLAKSAESIAEPSEINTVDISQTYGLVFDEAEMPINKKSWFKVKKHKIQEALNKFPKKFSRATPSLHFFSHPIENEDGNSNLEENSHSSLFVLPSQQGEVLFSPNEMVLVIFGRTRTSDYLLLEAARFGIKCYRMNEESIINVSSDNNFGYVTGIYIPMLDPRTGKYKIYYDEINHHPLPTVVYNFDFSSERRLLAHDRGSRIFFDNSQQVYQKLQRLKIPYFNQFSHEWLALNHLSPLRSELIFSHVLQKYAPDLFALYPTTVAISNENESFENIMQFITDNDSFYIKRSLNIHDSSHQQLDIYAYKLDDYLVLKYFDEMETDNGKEIHPVYQKIDLSLLTSDSFYKAVNAIKHKMGVAPNVQYIMQQSLAQPAITDQLGRCVSAKLRVITLHDTETCEVISSTMYGVYGGKNAFLGYVGCPSIYIERCQQDGYLSELEMNCIQTQIRNTAIACHQVIEKSMQCFLGEVVTDILISPSGIVPIRVNIKPERLNLEFIQQQTYYGDYLEKSDAQRAYFLKRLAWQEKARTQHILNTFSFLHLNNNDSTLTTEAIYESRV